MGYLRRHPVVLLLLLSPGIPEYLSNSSPLNAIVLNPPTFVVQLATNLSLYGPGVLLVREAIVRWQKGAGSLLLLGSAYGVLEEGTALATLFNPHAPPVGPFGLYGHWLGVNWVWVAVVIPVHVVYSISLPILLLTLAIPQSAGTRLLGGRKLFCAIAILGVDVAFLQLGVAKVEHYWAGPALVSASLAVVAALAILGFALPRTAINLRRRLQGSRSLVTFALGLGFYPSMLFTGLAEAANHFPVYLALISIILIEGAFLVFAIRSIKSDGNKRPVIALAAGLLLPIEAIGVISEARLPITLLADLLMTLFLVWLWRMYPQALPQALPQPGPEELTGPAQEDEPPTRGIKDSGDVVK